ncbi:nitric oxide reductase transcriptional regulator NorR [Parasalinivibrio latis]|uniref:nitric oxide reductase transcriptional regulator NorR n=1 Tax=Parasalinivibrio latis TaxID=2952610 RepID=UPI0030E140E9
MSNRISANDLISLALDLSASITHENRFQELLQHAIRVIPCDAVGLLKKQGDILVPLAMTGLTPDTLGRRFKIEEHPRLDTICRSQKPVRFPAESSLPDPYDGLVSGSEGDLPVHACMGLPLIFEGRLIGVLTFDALLPGSFDNIPEDTLRLVSSLASTSLYTALNIEQLETSARQSQQMVCELNQQTIDDAEMIGTCPPVMRLKEEINNVASSDFTVLIHGETGTGKELVARSVHAFSSRRHHPMIHINCAALPEQLIESELFGHVRGAFTGADRDRTGKFVLADRGTLFLDEIGELPLAAQSKLLRALQNGEIQPVGQDEVKTVDVRLIAATNRDLAKEVKEGRFRADLYHRLSVYPLHVPPLRERGNDIDLLCGFFLEQARRKLGIKQLAMAPGSILPLKRYNWPGNVREMQHLLDRAALKSRSRVAGADITLITEEDLGDLTPSSRPASGNEPEGSLSLVGIPKADVNLRVATEEFQRSLIVRILEEEQGNWSAAARRLETDRANLGRLGKRLNIEIKKVVS